MMEFLRDMLAGWAETGVPIGVIAAAALAVLGWLLPRALFRLTGMGKRAVLRTLVLASILLIGAGAVVAATLYATSGVQLGEAWRVDPWGGVLYFVATGAQLALAGLFLMAIRTAILTVRGDHRTLR